MSEGGQNVDPRSVDGQAAPGGSVGWPALRDLLSSSEVPVTLLEAAPDEPPHEGPWSDPAAVDATLADVVSGTGAVLVDHGWVRLLGAGVPGLPGVLAATARERDVEDWGPAADGGPGAVVVAYDVLGGRFALNRGALPGAPGELAYWGPDTLEWAALGARYETFPGWLVSGALETFYGDLRWPGWQDEVGALAVAEGIVCYPFLFSAEGREDISLSVRIPTPFGELLELHDDLARQVGYLPSAPTIRIRR